MKPIEDFTFTATNTIKLDRITIRSTLASVRDQLLKHEINGGPHKFSMDCVIASRGACGMAACIGGWTSIFLLGFEGGANYTKRNIVQDLFNRLAVSDDRLHKLFYSYDGTKDYNEPNVAATAIQRYLDGKNPWPKGKMPDVLRYKRKVK